MTQEESTEFERQIFNREKESPFFWIGPYALALKSDMIALKLKLVLLECKIQFPLEKKSLFLGLPTALSRPFKMLRLHGQLRSHWGVNMGVGLSPPLKKCPPASKNQKR